MVDYFTKKLEKLRVKLDILQHNAKYNPKLDFGKDLRRVKWNIKCLERQREPWKSVEK